MINDSTETNQSRSLDSETTSPSTWRVSPCTPYTHPAVIFTFKIALVPCFKIKDSSDRLKKGGKSIKLPLQNYIFYVFLHQSRAESSQRRQMGGKKQRAKNECVLMWNGEKNWSNGVKKLLAKWKGRHNSFLVDSRKAIWNSCWRAHFSILMVEPIGMCSFPINNSLYYNPNSKKVGTLHAM